MGLHHSWGDGDGRKLGCMGSTGGVWEGRSALLLVFPTEHLCAVPAHSVRFIRILVAGLRCWMLGNHGAVEGRQLDMV